ncbi:caspase family protein [Streptomyces sp. ISL-36]|uniref:caspase family protein n=1 Tax=Streptomyces sp. ISL-36 TaxID=2819182 RepID=UPI001BEC5798|nr:caspase family protein [Streptomyces sp. ISL-36]MBT2445205.1 caspase family protein [Streptomyces sp. ISL-36]
MPAGLSIHAGLNSVDPERYEGWDGALVACENDARDMARLARAAGFSETVLMTADATVDRLTAALRQAAGELAPDDILLLTYSGHGGQVPDVTGADEEPDALDETLVLYDRQFLDDELHRELRGFAEGVRIVVLLDCCHSGSGIELPGAPLPETGIRLMPVPRQQQIYERDRGFFEELQRSLKEASEEVAGPFGEAPEPSAVLISACQDNQVASDGQVNGAFTGALLDVWQGGAFRGGYRSFHRAIQSRLPATQSPNLYLIGSPPAAFLRQRPFTV